MGLFNLFKRPSVQSASRQPQIFSREEVMREHRQEAPKGTASTFDAMFGLNEEIAELNRRATSLGDAGKMDEAVTCLKKVADLNRSFIQSSPSEGMRLALYLQKAGRGCEAIEEMKRLIATVPAAVDACMSNGKPSSASDKARFEANQYAALFDKLRLIMQREKMKDGADECRQLEQQWADRAAALYQQQVMKATVDVPERPPLTKWPLQGV